MSELEVVADDVSAELVPVEGDRIVRVHGQPLDKLPEDLYIPPDALQVFLEAFEGPLDLLLYLIRRQNINILDIPVLKITQQYMKYIGLMHELRLELAAEYLLMAALLAEIKSRILLPRPVEAEEELGDPRMELVRRLQEYERFKSASESLDALPRMGRELHRASARPEVVPLDAPLPLPSLRELMLAFRDVMLRAELFTRHQISRDPLTVRERMTHILERIQLGPASFSELCDPEEGRAGVVIVLLAILEMVKLAMIDLVQEQPFAEVLIGPAKPRPTLRRRRGAAAPDDDDEEEEDDDAMQTGDGPALES